MFPFSFEKPEKNLQVLSTNSVTPENQKNKIISNNQGYKDKHSGAFQKFQEFRPKHPLLSLSLKTHEQEQCHWRECSKIHESQENSI